MEQDPEVGYVFVQMLAVSIALLDHDELVKPTARGVMEVLRRGIKDPPPGTTHLQDELQVMFDRLDQQVTKCVDYGLLWRDVDDVFREALGDDGEGSS